MVLTNDGLIFAGQIAGKVNIENVGVYSLADRGVIATKSFDVVVNEDSATSGRFVDRGTVQGAWSYLGGIGKELVVNRGEMVGQVDLGWGNDTFEDCGGTVEGSVSGRGGDDLSLPGLGDEDLDGGPGIDTLDFRGSAGLRVSLLDDSVTGQAEGDEHLNFERVLGSRSGANTLVGNAVNDTLLGFGGAGVLGERGRRPSRRRGSDRQAEGPPWQQSLPFRQSGRG